MTVYYVFRQFQQLFALIQPRIVDYCGQKSVKYKAYLRIFGAKLHNIPSVNG